MTTLGRVLDCSAPVHEIIERYPATRSVFQRFGVDTCCGGGISVEAAARRDGIDPDVLCTAVRAAAEGK